MPRRIGLLVDQWPAGDRSAWERAVTPRGPFDTAALAGHWRPKTRDQARYAYGRWLAYLQTRDPQALDLPIASRATPEAMRGYVTQCESRLTPMSIAAELQHLLLALHVLAPQGEWGWLRQLQYTFQRRARPRERRDKIVDPRRLLGLGEALMDGASGVEANVERARRYRDGLLIALLAARPMRRRSVAALRLGQHLHKLEDGYVIELEAEDTKTGHAVEFSVPAFLIARIDAYLAHYRPLFPGANASDALWLSSKGGALRADAIYDLVCRRTLEEFGTTIHPHLFRTIAVTAIAREAPEALLVARDLLTHSKIETTQAFYSRAQIADAARRYAETIAQLRERLPG